MKFSIGIDIGGTKSAVLLGNPQGKEGPEKFILRREAFETKKAGGPMGAIQKMEETIHRILQEKGLSTEDIIGIGVSCGGPLDSRRGVIMNPPNLPGWDNIPIKQILEKEFGLPVALENDANACAVAEWKYGAGRGYDNVIFLTFGTGLGAGLILDGKLYRGSSDMAGEVGHVRMERWGPVGYGKMGSFEGFCSGAGISQMARMKVLERIENGMSQDLCQGMEDLDQLNAKDIAIAADRGDELAIEIYRLCGEQLGRGLAMLVDILNPEIIIIGSIFQRCRHLLWPYAERVMKREALEASAAACVVVPAQLGENIGDYAALVLAEYNFGEKEVAGNG
ncbi:ROK family protein [uncultured Acetatifactor sp.]|uniref:ROK family protein n=1 Tax=uncultured Acetatifactor sp. TaxID=1671927 RepID=UPI0026398A97|nr:ROK family protein [uncultured Acetatifactor sp.]